eukprot:CAMPEP_0172396126 /NCGR_PEP_ID=MMETSP1061-20121228/23713_1 /TAXON_ID=37318 /ORGANISM="Pseudo-nitzschia pungens, Strain cf. pungens" /LENGTH=369 /DNA_ID=CAMNT_0013127909 /DNA_START=94 /DNA_END=1203 /DNA_ORIENTATION=-
MGKFRNIWRKRSARGTDSTAKIIDGDDVDDNDESDRDDYDSVGKPSNQRRRSSSEKLRSRWEDMTNSVTRSSRSACSSKAGGESCKSIPAISEGNDCDDDDDDEEDEFDEYKVGLQIQRTFGIREIGSDDSEKDDDNDSLSRESSKDDLQELDRATVRLDGIEVYAIVSALTCATSISCFDNFNPTPLQDLIDARDVITFLAELFYYAAGALGMMTGLHATLIFSLVTMYGRTALGIDRDDAFNQFFANTGAARFNGFVSFKLSLYCFMTQLTFLIGQKFVYEPLRPFVLAYTGYYAYKTMYMDSQNVVKAAAVIFTSPQPAHGEDRRASFRASIHKPARRGSSAPRKSSYSLSTRAFGVDTRKRAPVS